MHTLQGSSSTTGNYIRVLRVPCIPGTPHSHHHRCQAAPKKRTAECTRPQHRGCHPVAPSKVREEPAAPKSNRRVLQKRRPASFASGWFRIFCNADTYGARLTFFRLNHSGMPAMTANTPALGRGCPCTVAMSPFGDKNGVRGLISRLKSRHQAKALQKAPPTRKMTHASEDRLGVDAL